jgi:hypothetical protein
MDIEAGEFQADHRDIPDNDAAAAFFLRVIDISAAQICSLANSFAKLQLDCEDIFTGAFYFNFGLGAPE